MNRQSRPAREGFQKALFVLAEVTGFIESYVKVTQDLVLDDDRQFGNRLCRGGAYQLGKVPARLVEVRRITRPRPASRWREPRKVSAGASQRLRRNIPVRAKHQLTALDVVDQDGALVAADHINRHINHRLQHLIQDERLVQRGVGRI